MLKRAIASAALVALAAGCALAPPRGTPPETPLVQGNEAEMLIDVPRALARRWEYLL